MARKQRKGHETMPCGYVRENVPLRERLVHYRGCSDAACQARAEAARTMATTLATALRAQKEGA